MGQFYTSLHTFQVLAVKFSPNLDIFSARKIADDSFKKKRIGESCENQEIAYFDQPDKINAFNCENLPEIVKCNTFLTKNNIF